MIAGDGREPPTPEPGDETADFDYDAPRAVPVVVRPRDARALPTGAEIGRYIVLERLGQGGMGLVYAAYDPQLDRKVAVKLLHHDTEAGQASLLREAQAMARLTHANVVTVFDAGLIDDRVFVAMELVGGRTLREWLRGEARPWRDIVRNFREAGRGLAAVHAAGLVHRDFKPENVLIGADGHCRLSDFGLALLVGPEAPADGPPADPGRAQSSTIPTLRDGSSGAVTVAGTPSYMAPEQWRGAAPDALTDQFSFAVALYRALYGALPYDVAELRSWTVDQPPLVPREPPHVDGAQIPRWVWRALAPALAVQRGIL